MSDHYYVIKFKQGCYVDMNGTTTCGSRYYAMRFGSANETWKFIAKGGLSGLISEFNGIPRAVKVNVKKKTKPLTELDSFARAAYGAYNYMVPVSSHMLWGDLHEESRQNWRNVARATMALERKACLDILRGSRVFSGDNGAIARIGIENRSNLFNGE